MENHVAMSLFCRCAIRIESTNPVPLSKPLLGTECDQVMPPDSQSVSKIA